MSWDLSGVDSRANNFSLSHQNTVEPPVRDHPNCQAQVVAYESLDHNGSNVFLIRMW